VFAADPWFDCFSIPHRVKDGLRPPLRGGLRPSLTRHAIEERFRLYRVGGESVAQRIQLGTGLGLWLVSRKRLGASWAPKAVGVTL
jgi:hypothetical protein